MGCEETGEILGEKLHDLIDFANIAGAALRGPLGIVMRDLQFETEQRELLPAELAPCARGYQTFPLPQCDVSVDFG